MKQQRAYRKPKRRPAATRRRRIVTPLILAAFMERQASEWESMWDLGIPEVKRAMNAAAYDLRHGADAARQVAAGRRTT